MESTTELMESSMSVTAWMKSSVKRSTVLKLLAYSTRTGARPRPAPARTRAAAAREDRREAQALLGEDFSGVACADRWWAYDYLAAERRQFCWAHLVRDFTAHREGLGAQQP